MFNNELMFRRGTLLNVFTRTLRGQCQAKGVAEVRLRDGSVCKVAYVPAAGKHPYEDCAEGGFWGVDSARYWMANGESDQGPQLDMLELLQPATPAPVTSKPAPLTTEQVVDRIATTWDGCMYVGIGEDIDIGASLRTAAAALTAAQ